MYAGTLIETGTAEEIFSRPRHPYTLGLLQSIPRLDVTRRHTQTDSGPAEKHAAGARVVPLRAALQLPLGRLRAELPQLTRRDGSQEVACFNPVDPGGEIDSPRGEECVNGPGGPNARPTGGRASGSRSRAVSCSIAMSVTSRPSTASRCRSNVADSGARRRVRMRQVDTRASDPARTLPPGRSSSTGATSRPYRRADACGAGCRWCSRIHTHRSTRATRPHRR